MAFPTCVIYGEPLFPQTVRVWTTRQLLAKLDERGIKNADVARALNVSPSRITELKKGERKLSLDEGATLVSKFDLALEPSPRVPALPAQVSRLVVLYIAAELGVDVSQRAPQVEELARDVRAFSEFVADRRNRESIQAAENFFEAMRLRRPMNDEAGPPGSDPARAL